MKNSRPRIAGRMLVAAAMILASAAANAAPTKLSPGATLASGKGQAEVSVLIDTSDKNYRKIVSRIKAMGGTVTNEFRYVNGLAAKIPASGFAELSGMMNVEGITLDGMQYPGPEGAVQSTRGSMPAARSDLDVAPGAALQVEGGSIKALPPGGLETYNSYYPDSMNTAPVLLDGTTGAGSRVVVIDTGTYAEHLMLAPRVEAGVDLSSDVGTGFEGATLSTNHWHGTHVGGIIAGQALLTVPSDDLLVQSIEYYRGPLPDGADPDTKEILLLGTAPEATIFPIKVFPHTGAGAPTSTIIAGIEYAIDMQMNGTDVDVINMSLGGGTGFEGRDLESQAVDAATAAGIAVVVSAGNDGPATQTIGSPSGANTAITTGAVAHPVNTRVFWDINYDFLGVGDLLYVDDNPQMVYFSSRGNTSDGRQKPTASAVGVFVLSSVTPAPTDLAWASGTSMASPGMAGVVALLNSYSEAHGLNASPYDYKQAVIAGSHPLPGYDEYEQGAGFIDAEAAMTAFLADSSYGSMHPKLRRGYSANSSKPPGMQLEDVNDEGGQTIEIVDLPPGYVEDYYFKLHPNADRIVVEFSNVDLGVDPIEFNSFEVHVMSAQRTTDTGYYAQSINVWGDAEFSIESMNTTASGYIFGFTDNLHDKPLMPGNVRISIENDWTSFDALSGTVNIRVEHGNNSDKPDESYSGVLNTGDYEGMLPGWGPNGAMLEASWRGDWRKYSASDLDLIVVWCDSNDDCYLNLDGATFSSPEIVDIDSNDVQFIYAEMDGYETYGSDESWALDVYYK